MSGYGEAEQVEFLLSVVKEAKEALDNNKEHEAYKILNALLKTTKENQK